MAESVEGAGLSASVTVSVLDAPNDDRDVGVAPATIMAMLSEKVARSPDDTWTRATFVDLPWVGRAARSHGVEDIVLPDRAGWIRTTMMQTFVPIPQSEQIVLISCSSPNVVLVDALHDLFDAVSSTFRFVPEDGQVAAPM
jgi:hypothetical protein